MKKNKEETIDCKNCIYSVQLKHLNCKLKIKDKEETEYSRVNTVIGCVWYKEKKVVKGLFDESN